MFSDNESDSEDFSLISPPPTSSTTRKWYVDENGYMDYVETKILIPIRRQNWSLPDTIIYYITMSPSSAKGYKKLIQTCKYFFNKNPIIVIDKMYYNFDWEICINMVEENLSNYRAKLWLTYSLGIDPQNFFNPNFASSSFVPKLYQCDIKELRLCHQIITFDELKFLSSKAVQIYFLLAIVKNQDGKILAVEKLVEAFSNVKIYVLGLNCTHPRFVSAKKLLRDFERTISSKTMKEFLKIPHFSKIDEFHFEPVPESFDIETFYKYIKTCKHTKFNFHFSDSISEAYKNRLEAIVDDIISSEEHDYQPPYISFEGQDHEKSNKLYKLFRKK